MLFLAAQSSSRSLVVGPSVGFPLVSLSVRPLVRPSVSLSIGPSVGPAVNPAVGPAIGPWKIVKKLKNSNYDKTHKLKLWKNLKYEKFQFMKKKILKKVRLVRTLWHLDKRYDVLWAAFHNSWDVLRTTPLTVVKPDSHGTKELIGRAILYTYH